MYKVRETLVYKLLIVAKYKFKTEKMQDKNVEERSSQNSAEKLNKK